MKKLKTILLFSASKYAHISLIISLFLFATKHQYLIIFVIVYLIFIYYKFKQLMLITLFFVIFIGIRIIQINQVKPENLPINGEVIEVHSNYLIVKSKYRYIVYDEDAMSFKPGMIIYIEGKFIEYDQKHVEHNFNYSEYLKTQKIVDRIDSSHISILTQKYNLNIVSFHIKNYFDENYSKDVSTYMKLFILGYKEDLDDSVKKLSNDIGISHLFAISGMHLGFIVLMLNKILQLFYLKRQTYHFILTIFLLFYNIVTGFSISIVRASLFLFIILLTKESKRRFSASDYLSFVFIAFLGINPYYIFSLGFQLSFLMAYVLILFKALYIHKQGISKLLLISFIAIVFSLPITLSINKTFGLLNVLLNPIFIVYVSLILLPGAIILLVCPYLSPMYLFFVKGFERLMIYVAEINIYYNYNFSNSFIKLLFWLVIVITIVYYKKHKRRIAFLWFGFIVVILQFTLLNDDVKVILFDVNQAEASYIQTKDCRLLIDTGGPDDYDTLIQYFTGENIKSLDAIILTHQHQDHYGEINDILSAINVKKLYVSKIYENTDLSIQKVVSKGDIINCGNTPIYVLNGDQGFENENNNALVLYTMISGESWLFTGDIENEIEAMMIREYHFEVDHLKVAHHGSKTSSTKMFIQHFKPKYAYISAGKNSYGFPSEKVIQNLYEELNNIYITKEQGSIVNVYGKLYRYRYFYYNGKKDYEIIFNI
ncbi:MAG: DNA internalization-related competence protein ComEC/Rec2 [Tenericutes bacterium]|nr:DNA internalization-related competence protein ComEC/Rec2 [Mycoplasmatota bacterium]